jgi:hypothetical protein
VGLPAFPTDCPTELKEKLLFTNTTDFEMEWVIKDQSIIGNGTMFGYRPIFGTLQPGETETITFSFLPDAEMTYVMDGALIATYNDRDVNFPLQVKGKCVKPSVSFDPPELFLPIVHVGVFQLYVSQSSITVVK